MYAPTQYYSFRTNCPRNKCAILPINNKINKLNQFQPNNNEYSECIFIMRIEFRPHLLARPHLHNIFKAPPYVNLSHLSMI